MNRVLLTDQAELQPALRRTATDQTGALGWYRLSSPKRPDDELRAQFIDRINGRWQGDPLTQCPHLGSAQPTAQTAAFDTG